MSGVSGFTGGTGRGSAVNLCRGQLTCCSRDETKLRSELECAAYHEAAHTVIARVFSIAIDFVGIDDMGGTLLSGVTAISFHDTVTTDHPNAENKMMLAGPLADIRFARLRDLAFDIDTAARDYWRADCRVVKKIWSTLRAQGELTPS